MDGKGVGQYIPTEINRGGLKVYQGIVKRAKSPDRPGIT